MLFLGSEAYQSIPITQCMNEHCRSLSLIHYISGYKNAIAWAVLDRPVGVARMV